MKKIVSYLLLSIVSTFVAISASAETVTAYLQNQSTQDVNIHYQLCTYSYNDGTYTCASMVTETIPGNGNYINVSYQTDENNMTWLNVRSADAVNPYAHTIYPEQPGMDDISVCSIYPPAYGNVYQALLTFKIEGSMVICNSGGYGSKQHR